MATFVSVGNAKQPFPRLLTAVEELARQKALPQPVIVQSGSTPFSSEVCISIPFLDMKGFAQHIQQAEIVIMHAGAGSVIHACRAGKIPIVMPRQRRFGEHIDDHQIEFARHLEQTAKLIVVERINDLEEAIRRVQDIRVAASEATGREILMLRLVRIALAEVARGRSS